MLKVLTTPRKHRTLMERERRELKKKALQPLNTKQKNALFAWMLADQPGSLLYNRTRNAVHE